MWRTFLVATDQEEWEGVWDDLIKSRNNADRFLEVIKGKKLRWLLHKVKTQFHHSRSFHVTGSRAAQRGRRSRRGRSTRRAKGRARTSG